MRRSFAIRLAAAFAAVGAAGAALTALVVNLAFGGLFGGYVNQHQQASQQEIMSSLAGAYARSGSWQSADLDGLAPSLRMSGAEVRVEDVGGATVWDLASSSAGGMTGGMMRGSMVNRSSLGPPQRLPVVVGGSVVGTAVIQLPSAGSLPADLGFRNSVNRLLLLVGVGAGLLAALLGVLLARRATAPVRDLTRAARGLAEGDRDQRVEHRSDDEFGAMAQAFNSMADSIDEEDRLRRTFAADVAHELRTPLMILSSQLEAMEDGVMERGPEAIASLQEETQRLTRLVSDLEVLASADAAQFSLERRPIDLASEVRDVVAEFTPLSDQSSVHLETSVEQAPVFADPARLRQVVANLLSNALKLTPAGGTVRLGVHPNAGQGILEVRDSGPGISEAEMGQVFERFFRGQGSRAGGSGIGLTVVRELVQAHGGTVTAANQPGGGAVFTVKIPLADAPASAKSAPVPAARVAELLQ
jgi:two-component system, OmpR family, sensor histidine kinase BaeS